ncbi:hypothetical protein TVAGG3_0691460, partial [Trichomonas vaginalis G3]|uniref:hypothetical protein n=1 Tax=Trichomonas vaginalis (strain ATCC PRA-98 / G3) TaxID=412133 RepID=UPI0021E53680
MKKQKYAIKNPDSDEAKFFDSLTKEQKYGHIDYDPKTLEKITKDDVDESTQNFFNSIKKYINNSQSLMRPVYTIIMQQSDPIEIHYPIVVSSFISLGETFKDAVEKTKAIWREKFPHNDYNLPKYNNVLCIIKSLLFDHRLARSILFITKHYESVPVVNEFLDVLSYFKRFIIINLYENNFKQPRNIYANKSSLQICEQFMKERSNEHLIFLIQGNNPSIELNLDIVNQQKPYSNPDDPSDDYNPYTHIDGFSVHLNPKQMPRMHFLMVCNKKDLVNNVPLSMQDRLNAITLSFNDYIKNFEEFVDAQDTLTQNDKNELMNKFEKFKFDAMRIRKMSPGDDKPCNHDLSDIEKYNKCDLNQINVCSMSFTKQEIAISPEVNFYLEKIISPDEQIKIVSPITLEDLNNTGNAIDGIIVVWEFKKSNIGILRKQWLAKKKKDKQKESSAKILIEHLKRFKTPLIFNGFSSQYEILFYLGATDDQFFHIGLESSQNDEELKEIIDEFKAIHHDEEKYHKCIDDDEILRARIIRYGMEHFTEAYVKEYEEKIKNDKDLKKCVEEIKEIKDPAVEDMHLNLSDYIQNKKMCICVTNDYVNDFKFETESNIDFVLHEMVANETMLFNYIQNKNTIISISHQDHNELYHYTSLIEDFFNKTKCTNHVAIVLQVKGTKIPDYVISTSKWPVYWIDTPSKNFGANQIVAIHKQIKSKYYDPLNEIVLSHLENKHKKIQKEQKEILREFVQKYIQENAGKCLKKFNDQSNKDQSNKDQSNKNQSNIQNLNRVFINCFCNTLEEFYDKFYFMLKRYEEIAKNTDNTGNADKFKNEIDFIKIVDNKMKFSELDYPTKRFILSLDEQGIKGNIVQSFNSANNFSSLSYVFCYIFNHNDNNRFEDEIKQMKEFLSPKMLEEDKFTPKPKDSEGLTGNEIKANTIDRKIYGENPDLKDCFEQDETKDLAVSKIDDTNKAEISSEYYTLKEKIQGKNPRNLIFDLFDHEIQAGDRAYTDPQLFEFIKYYKGNFFKDMLNDFKNEQSLENSKFVNSFFLENEIHFEGQEEKEESANKNLALFINENSQEALIFHIVTASDNNYQSTKYCLMTIKSFVTYYLFMNESSEQKMKFLEILEQFVKPSKEKESKAERTKHIKPVYDFLEKWKAMFRCHLEALYILCLSYSYDKLLGIKSKLGRDNLFVEFITDLEKSGKTEDSGELVDFREYINENPSLKDRSFKDQINSYLEEL